MNQINLIGRLTKNPELRKTTSGLSVASFTLAVDNPYSKGPNGEKVTIFIGCSIFGNKADGVARFTKKASFVAVSGRISQRKYTNKDNVQVTVTEVIADSVDFLDPKQDNKPAEKKPSTPEEYYQSTPEDADLPF